MSTPIIKINDFWIKREDLNLTGSVKDRSLELQVKHLCENNYNSAVISSTGNAAISALHFCRQAGINLTIFVSPKINQDKLHLLSQAQIIKSATPVSDAFQYAKANHAYNLRQSTDPVALSAYSKIGEEILTDLPQITSIFFPVGSGCTLLGTTSKLPSTVKIFAVQPTSNPTIAKYFDNDFAPATSSLTDALSVKSLPLKDKILSAIHNSNGGGFAITDSEIRSAQTLLSKHSLDTSPESALALAGYNKALRSGTNIGQYPLIIFTGCNRHHD